MVILGFQKTTLLDYPEHLAATIFLGGCNFDCPFCHNSSIIHPPFTQNPFSEEEVLSYLKKRSHILEGACITGGEPTLCQDLPAFCEKIKETGLKIKLDTNGSNPEMLKELYKNHLIDYVAMDIKSSKENYLTACGLCKKNDDASMDMLWDKITSSIHFLIHETDERFFSYEFRTTVVNPLHKEADFADIGRLIQGARAYFLQSFEMCENPKAIDFSSYPEEKLNRFLHIVSGYVKQASIRNTLS